MNGSWVRRDSGTVVFSVTFIVGVLALCAGWIGHIEGRAMYSIAVGCIPTGVLGIGLSLWSARWVPRNRPEWIERKRAAADERSIQVNHHAGYSAFWVSFVYVAVSTLLSPTRLVDAISHTAVGSAMMVLMALAYWTAVVISNRRY